jgi:hypothetical protein
MNTNYESNMCQGTYIGIDTTVRQNKTHTHTGIYLISTQKIENVQARNLRISVLEKICVTGTGLCLPSLSLYYCSLCLLETSRAPATKTVSRTVHNNNNSDGRPAGGNRR